MTLKEYQRYGSTQGVVKLTKNIIAPPAVIVRLRYNVSFRFTNAALAYVSNSYNVNGLYDVDPLVGSAAIPGFTEWMALYQTYQVISCRAHLVFTNLSSTSPAEVAVAWIQGTQAQNTFTPAEYNGPWSSSGNMSVLGGDDTFKYDRKVYLAELNGTDAYWGSVSYFQGTAGTNPATPMQLLLGCNSPTGATTLSPSVTGFLEFEARFSTNYVMVASKTSPNTMTLSEKRRQQII